MLDRKRSRRRRNITALCVFFIIIFFSCPLETYASWTDRADDSIYSEGESVGKGEEKAEKAGSFERKVSGLFRNLATGLNDLLLKEGCDLDRIILGRVKSGGQKKTLFTFELRKGNAYGVVAAAVYKILRSIMFVVIAGIMFTKLVKGQFTSGNAKIREEMKGALSITAIGFSLLVLMPFLYDVFLYFRDILLFAVAAESTGEMGLIESFFAASEESGLFIDAMLYLAAVCASVWFALEYIGIAMANIVMFICFVFVAALLFFDKRKLMNWCWNVLSLGITPIIDISMLMVPVFMGNLTKGQHPFIQLLVTWSVIPSRKLFKNALGLTSTGEAVMSGLSAIAMMHGAASFVRGGVGLAQNTGEKLKGSMDDKKKQRFHEDMARTQEEWDSDPGNPGSYVSEKHENHVGARNSFGIYKEGKEQLQSGMGTWKRNDIENMEYLEPDNSVSRFQAPHGKDFPEDKNNEYLKNMTEMKNENAVMEKYATVDNFEQPEFKNLDHAKKAELYGKRARRRLLQGIGIGIAGTTGLTGGALFGVSATGFYSRSTASMTTGMLAEGGSAFLGRFGSMAASGISSVLERGSAGQADANPQDMEESDIETSAWKHGAAGFTQNSIQTKGEAYVRPRENAHVRAKTNEFGMAKQKPVSQQVQEASSDPKTRQVVSEFCREMAMPGSRVMQHYEQSARSRFSNYNAQDGNMGQEFETKVCHEMANQMSLDIMKRISSEGVSISSGEAYGALRESIQSNIQGVLNQWNDRSEFKV